MSDQPQDFSTLEKRAPDRSAGSQGPPRQANVRTASGAVATLVRGLPTLLLVAALGALAFWGHHTGWSFPKFSALTGTDREEPNDWCGAHGVAESVCVECNPELMPRKEDYGWCQRHGIPNCPFEHPDVAQLREAPQIRPADLERASRALDFLARQENNSKCKLHQRRLQLASQEVADKAGIEVDEVGEGPMVESVTANGEVTYDQTRVARLSSRAPGTVWRVMKHVGDRVSRREILALVDAAEVGKAKAEFLQAVVGVELKGRIYESLRASSGAVSERQVQEGYAALREAQIRLVNAEQALVNLGLPVRGEEVKGLSTEAAARYVQLLGLPGSVTEGLDPRTTSANFLPLKAPHDGVVISREVVAGEVVDAAKSLFVVADLSQMWLTLNLRLEDTAKVAIGQAVQFRADGLGVEVSGTVAWVSTAVDEKTRTRQVRANLTNSDGRLPANVFGKGRVVLREEPRAVVVPSEAVQWEGDCNVVFVRDKNYDPRDPKGLLVYHVRTVRPGAKDEKQTEIIAGLLPREVIVTKGVGLLRAELLKNNLGES